MKIFYRLTLLTALHLLLVYSNAQGIKSGPIVSLPPTYSKDIKPILQQRCVVCHCEATLGNLALSGGLALDTFAGFKKGVIGQRPQPVIIPGKSNESEIIKRFITTSPAKLMPKGGPPLSPSQISLFKTWIDAGAPTGVLGAEVKTSQLTLASLPMPLNRPLLEVILPTRLEVTPDLHEKSTPKDAALTLALKIGPLPAVTTLAYSPDGKQLAVGAYRAVVIWDTTTGHPLVSISHLPGAVQGLAYRPDSTQLAVAGGTPGAFGEVRVYDAHTFAQTGKVITGHSDVVLGIAWRSDGLRIATASQDKSARLWEWPSGKELMNFKDHSDAVTHVAFAPDGKSVYTACLDHNVRRFDVEKGRVIRLFTGHNEAVTALAINLDGKRILTSGTEPNIRWWNTDDGNITNNNGGHSAPVNEITISKDGKFVLTASADMTVRLWDGNSTGHIREMRGTSDWVYTVAISPDDNFAAGAGADGIVRIWEAATGKHRLSLISWPGETTEKLNWASLTPEGYYDSSADWSKQLHLLLGGLPVKSPRLAGFIATLHQPAMLLKVWQGLPLDVAKLPAMATTPAVSPKK